MSIEVETKDCTALSDAEMAEMADLAADCASRYEIGLLSKQADEWVLVTLVRDGTKLKGYSFSTLERIGGTPSVLLGLACVARSSKRDTVLRQLMSECFRRALMAFPDEDVLIGSRLVDESGFEAFRSLQGIVPRPGHKASGEERAWGRRLAKRFGFDNGDYDDRNFVARGDGQFPLGLDHESLRPEQADPDVKALFDPVDRARGDALITFGWAMAEDLLKYG